MLVSHQDAQYWTNHNVTNHHQFKSIEESLEYLHWRNAQYQYYDGLMSCQGYDGKIILDYGCGPGNDLIALGHYSKPQKLYGADVSKTSLLEAKARLDLHKIDAELIELSVQEHVLPFPDNSVDYIHSSGVLHHIPNYRMVLREFQRVLKPGGTLKIMVYNYDSLWLHLYVAYIKQIVEQTYEHLSIREAFSKTTDGPDCPTSYIFKPTEFSNICEEEGFSCKFLGAAISAFELSLLPRRFDAIMDPRLPREHRNFLVSLTFDKQGCPLYGEEVAGIDACYQLIK